MKLEERVEELERMAEQLKKRLEEVEAKVKRPPGSPPQIVEELLGRLEGVEEGAGAILGSVWKTESGTGSSLHTSAKPLEYWSAIPDSCVLKAVKPLADPKSLSILRALLDGKEKTKEELKGMFDPPISDEELEGILNELRELRYIKLEGRGFRLNQRYGLDLLMAALHLADQQRHEEGS